MTLLADIYEEMDEYKKAIELYEKAAELGDIRGTYLLGALYIKTKEYDKSYKFIKKAADLGNKYAIDLLQLYDN